MKPSREDVLGVAKETKLDQLHIKDQRGNEWRVIDLGLPELERFAASMYAKGAKDMRERAAIVAASAYDVMKETEHAHYKLSAAPFNPYNFGFNLSVTRYSDDAATRIRALPITPEGEQE